MWGGLDEHNGPAGAADLLCAPRSEERASAWGSRGLCLGTPVWRQVARHGNVVRDRRTACWCKPGDARAGAARLTWPSTRAPPACALSETRANASTGTGGPRGEEVYEEALAQPRPRPAPTVAVAVGAKPVEQAARAAPPAALLEPATGQGSPALAAPRRDGGAPRGGRTAPRPGVQRSAANRLASRGAATPLGPRGLCADGASSVPRRGLERDLRADLPGRA